MNASTLSYPVARFDLGRLLRRAGATLRRAFELAGGPYLDGARPM